MINAAVISSRVVPALSHRSWTMDGATRCHAFLLLGGTGLLTPFQGVAVEQVAPAMLWLPHSTPATLRVMAGGSGFSASISPDFVQRTVGDPGIAMHLRSLLDAPVLAGPDRARPSIGALTAAFAALTEETQAEQPAGGAMTGLLLATLLLQLWRCAGALPPSGQRVAGASTVQRFRQLVELHYREGLGIDAFATQLGVTRGHLHDACVRATGQTPLRLLHARVLTEARTRLQQTELPVEQVGYGIGFRDPGYFNRFFKRLAGQTPGEFRRSARTGVTLMPPAPSFSAWP